MSDYYDRQAAIQYAAMMNRALGLFGPGKETNGKMIAPQNDMVLVDPVEETMKGSLFIPERAKDSDVHRVGLVRALPPDGGDLGYSIDVVAGDTVIYDNRSSVTFSANGESGTLVRARDILAVIR